MKRWWLFLTICSFLSSAGMVFTILFTFMYLGGMWYEPYPVIALLEVIGSILLLSLGLVGWCLLVIALRQERCALCGLKYSDGG